MTSLRESFLRGAFARLDAEKVPYLLTRNANDLYHSTTSDVDLVVPREAMARAESAITTCAEQFGYRKIARIEFTNLCLVYWSPGADFVRIDLDAELRWHVFEVAEASTLFDSVLRCDGVNVVAPQSERLVMADRLAWKGSLSQRYRSRVDELLADHGTSSCSGRNLIDGFLASGDARGLRCHLALRTLANALLAKRALIYAVRDINRILRRLVRPPGLFIMPNARPDGFDWPRLFRTMSMAFPESKCARVGTSPLPGLLGLFRGGIVIADPGRPIPSRICAWFSARSRRFRIIDSSTASAGAYAISLNHDDTVETFADRLAESLAKRHAGECGTSK